MMQATVVAGRRVAVAPSRANRMPLASRRVVPVRAQAEEPNSTPSTSSSSPTPSSSPLMSAPASEEVQGPTGSLALLGPVQEAINGRAAMLGFVAAVISEAATHQAVWSQVAGRYAADGDLLEAPVGTATLLFGAIVALVTMATLVPKMVAGEEVDSRSFGPFTPGLEKNLGRVAQIGFAGLLVVELVKGSALLG